MNLGTQKNQHKKRDLAELYNFIYWTSDDSDALNSKGELPPFWRCHFKGYIWCKLPQNYENVM